MFMLISLHTDMLCVAKVANGGSDTAQPVVLLVFPWLDMNSEGGRENIMEVKQSQANLC